LPELWTAVDSRGERSEVLKLLHLVDPTIEDIRISVDKTQRAVIRVQTPRNELSPLECEGAGFAKSLLLASAVVVVKDGMLLIDEFDSSLHVGIQRPVADFLLKAASRHRVQLYISTHSLETLDMLLDAFESSQGLFSNENDCRVIQLRRQGNDTSIRNYGFPEARKMREELGIDLRYAG
jgi:AAA15 family ATPase/GTPase